MGNKLDNEREFKAVSYFRLLKYCKPYWGRLVIGIVSGLIVGGSLFGSLMVIPKMVMIVDPQASQAQQAQSTAEKIVTRLDSQPLPKEEKEKLVAEILHPTETMDKELVQSMNQLRKYAKDFHLPVTVNKTSITLHWPTEYEFSVSDAMGRISWQFFAIYVIFFILTWILKNAATFTNHYFTRWVGQKVVNDMRNEIFSKLLNQSLKFYGKQDIGHLISRCTNDVAAIESSVSETVADATRCPLEILACAAAILFASWQYNNFGMMILIGCGMMLCILPIIFLGRRIRKTFKKSFAKIADVLSRMHETFTGILVVKACNTEQQEIEVFRNANRKYFKNVIRALRMQLMMQPLMEIVAVTATLIFLLYSYSRGVTISEMLVLLAPAILAYRPIKDLAKVVTSLQKSMAAADRYFDIIDTDTALREIPNPVDFKAFRDQIEFRSVEFSYDGNRRILDGVSFSIPKGSMVAVVGETGSGKTTIANLIARFYDSTGGAVLIDGTPVGDYSIASLREQIGIVTQVPILFNDTIANNIAYGCHRNVSREEIIEAAKQANAHQFIVDGRHAQGYDTEVGEKGFKLSGGEKQRVAIARAILKNPPILILDEATSALDTVTEKLVQEALNKVMTNRTVFAIAHRLSTIQNADTIIVLEKGRIVESGTHAELLALNGRYKRLHDTQFTD